MSSQRDFQNLFWFEHNGSKFQCSKTQCDEVYRVKQIVPKTNWVRSEKYMTRANYEKFLSEKGIC